MSLSICLYTYIRTRLYRQVQYRFITVSTTLLLFSLWYPKLNNLRWKRSLKKNRGYIKKGAPDNKQLIIMQLSHRMAAVLCNCCWKQPRCRIEFPSLCCTTSPSTILGVQNQEFLFNKTKNGPTRSQPAVKSNHLVLILVTPFRLVLSAFVDFTL